MRGAPSEGGWTPGHPTGQAPPYQPSVSTQVPMLTSGERDALPVGEGSNSAPVVAVTEAEFANQTPAAAEVAPKSGARMRGAGRKAGGLKSTLLASQPD